MVEGKGRGLITYSSHITCFVTTHALSRVCQRWQVRTVDDLTKVITKIGGAALEYIIKNDDGSDDWHRKHRDGVRVPLRNHTATMVLKAHEKYHAMVVATLY
jgi:hypothetical protein